MEEGKESDLVKNTQGEGEKLLQRWQSGFLAVTGELGNLIHPEKREDYVVYFDFLGAAMDFGHLWANSPELEQLRRQIYEVKSVSYGKAKEIAQALTRLQPFKGMRVLEIGGPFAQVLHLLGATEAVCIDPRIRKWPYKPPREGYREIPARFDLDNFESQIGGKDFDLVLSRQLLGFGSRLEASRTRREFSTLDEFCLAYLAAFAQLTKKGGLNIHNGDMKKQSPEIYKEMELTLLKMIPTIVIQRAGSEVVFMKTFIFKKE